MNLGALVAGVWRFDDSSTTPNEIMSTMLETSFLTRSGRELGRSFPVSLRLHKYMARANSGKRSWPDLVVSARVLHLLESGHVCDLCNIPDVRKRVPR